MPQPDVSGSVLVHEAGRREAQDAGLRGWQGMDTFVRCTVAAVGQPWFALRRTEAFGMR